jgi:hypothetical protein
MDHDAGLGIPFGMAVAADMRAGVKDFDFEAFLRQFACDDGTGQTRANNPDFLTLCHQVGFPRTLGGGAGSSLLGLPCLTRLQKTGSHPPVVSWRRQTASFSRINAS